MLKTILAASALTWAAFSTCPSFAEETRPMPRTISLTGHGEVKATPDTAMITMGVSSHGDTARASLDDNSKAMKALLESLKAAGIDAKDIQTSNFSINPTYGQQEDTRKPPKVVGYETANAVTVIVRKIADLGSILDKVVSSGANQVNSISFNVANPDAALDQARNNAVADAKRKAELYAAATGGTLGSVISITESSGYNPPAPVYTMAMKARMSTDVPIAQGEQTLSIDITMVWDIK